MEVSQSEAEWSGSCLEGPLTHVFLFIGHEWFLWLAFTKRGEMRLPASFIHTLATCTATFSHHLLLSLSRNSTAEDRTSGGLCTEAKLAAAEWSVNPSKL